MSDPRLVKMKDLLTSGLVHWKCNRSVYRAIENEKFPHYLINGVYAFDLEEVKLWFKKREQRAS
jgi:hypothetical protein